MRRIRHLAWLPIVALVAVGGGLEPASSLAATITDPKDVPACETPQDCPIDIRFVSKRAYTNAAGRRMLAMTVEAYELYGGLVEIASIKLLFDSRGGPRPDRQVLMSLANLDSSIGWACGRSFGQETYRIRELGDRLTCFAPRQDLRPTRAIRFRALSRGNDFVVDRAPNRGWGG